MGSKNNHRFKIRKHMNSIKHEPKSLFNEPPILIRTWNDLIGLENENYILDIEEDMGCGWVKPKHEVPEDEYYDHNKYLSTHTFYGSQYFYSTTTLRRLGFNVQLENWDGETIYCKQ